jgi:hypothetical protein
MLTINAPSTTSDRAARCAIWKWALVTVDVNTDLSPPLALKEHLLLLPACRGAVYQPGGGLVALLQPKRWTWCGFEGTFVAWWYAEFLGRRGVPGCACRAAGVARPQPGTPSWHMLAGRGSSHSNGLSARHGRCWRPFGRRHLPQFAVAAITDDAAAAGAGRTWWSSSSR